MTDTLTGIVADLPEETYFASPALSSTGARLILDSPARFHYRQTHPEPITRAFDVGSAVHAKVLGVGAPIVTIPDSILASNGAISTKEAKEFVEQARLDGLIPVKEAVADEIHAMVEAVLSHPTARTVLEQAGMSEASVFATDDETGVDLRARFDFLADDDALMPWAVDLKTTATSASPSGFAKAAASHGYHVQQGHYIDALEIVTGIRRPFIFIVVEKDPPHLVAVHQLDRDFTDMGHVAARAARARYRECTDTDTWPGYDTAITLTPPPVWAIYDHQDRFE